MSEEELQLLITLDDPVDGPEEDIFHLQTNNKDAYTVTFGEGDWTCTLSRLTGATNVEVCTVTHWKNGEIVEQKVFYDLSGMQKQIGTISAGESQMSCCSHLFEISDVTPKTPDGCEECLKIGDRWVHLRLCAICGHVGCCDESKNKHAIKHFHLTNHPLMKSFEAGDDWGWCYVDELFFESFPGSFTTQWCGVLGVTP